ncbi:MAG: hypothetical protein M1825_000220 [Sarcosagium campestre]|nr:MAG: hypothetical protein M1825_000220 [Sarcosagium campestre]
MVLEDASSPPPGDSFSDASPLSDADPYSDSAASLGASFPVNIPNFVHPVPVLGPLTGWNEQKLTQELTRYLEYNEKIVRRRLSHDECEALLSSSSYGLGYQPWGSFAGGVGGTLIAYKADQRTRVRIAAGKIGPLTRLWRVARLPLYTFLGFKCGLFAATVMGAFSTLAGVSSDSRLTQYTKDLRAISAEDRNEMRRKMREGHSKPQIQKGNTEDYTSSTEGMFSDPSPEPSPDPGNFEFGSAEEDATPSENAKMGNQVPEPGRSAWDRIRRNGGSPHTGPKRIQGRVDDSLSPSRTDEEAQRLFDDSVQREREGGDFSGSGKTI